MRIVADTNTVISGLLWKGAPRQIIQACRQQRITIVSSESLIAELAEVLARDKFASRIKGAGLTPSGLVEDYSALTEQAYPEPLEKPVCRDPDDADQPPRRHRRRDRLLPRTGADRRALAADRLRAVTGGCFGAPKPAPMARKPSA